LSALEPRSRPVSAIAIGRTSTVDGQLLAVNGPLVLLAVTDLAGGRVPFYRLDFTPLGVADGTQDGPQTLKTPAGVAIGQGHVYGNHSRGAPGGYRRPPWRASAVSDSSTLGRDRRYCL
jgi:hypothetical protein